MKSTMHRAASPAVLATLILTLLPGCFSLGRTTPPLERYVIGGAESPGALVPAAGLEGLAVGVRRIDLAPYIASFAIVVRRGEHEVLTSDFHQWAEDPTDGINRAVARHLDTGAPFRAVNVAPWPVRTPHDYLIQLHVTRFEGVVSAESSPPAGSNSEVAEGAVHVRVSWEIIRPEDGTVLGRGGTDHRAEGWRVGDYAALVALLDEGLVVVARDVAAAIAELVTGAPADGGPIGDGLQ